MSTNTVEIKFYPAGWNDYHNVSMEIVGNNQRCNPLLDTGSTGIVLGDKFRPANAKKLSGIKNPSYNSSGNTYEGDWYSVAVNFFQPHGKDPVATTQEIPVFFATNKDPFMVGVGVDRNYDSSFNPFLNLATIGESSDITQGYVLRNQSVNLGLTPELEEGFPTPVAASDVTATVTMKLSQDGKDYSFQCEAPLLVDTGITFTIVNDGYTDAQHYPVGLHVPGKSAFTNGTDVTISGPISFHFTQGKQITVPKPGGNGDMELTEAGRFGFSKGGKIINTGASPLRDNDILVIADGEKIAFKPAS